MKKTIKTSIVSLLLVALLLPNFTVVAGATNGNNSAVRLDDYVTSHYAVALFQEDESFFSVTVERGNHVEFSITQADTPIYSVWTTLEQLGDEFVGKDHSLLIDDSYFIDAVYTFGQQQVQSGNATVGNIEFIPYDPSAPVPHSVDLAILRGLVEDIHGQRYDMEDWTGFGDEDKYGLTFSYLETLDIEEDIGGVFTISDGLSLGAAASKFAARFLVNAATALTVLGVVLGVASAVTSLILDKADIFYYDYAVTYARDVLIDGAGPYWHGAHQYYYTGYINMTDTNPPYLLETAPDTYFPEPENIFNSYVIQRERAYENYQNQ